MKIPKSENFIPSNNEPYLQNILNQYSDFFEKLVNLGSNLIEWDVEKKRKGRDNHIPTLFLRNLIELCDSLSILVRKSSIDPSKIIIRSLLENSISLIYMIKNNETQNTLSYIVWKTNQEISYYKQFLTNEDNHRNLKKNLIQEGNEKILNEVSNSKIIKEIISNKIALLKTKKLKLIQKEYYRTKGKKKTVKYWYNLFDGPSNFFELCKYSNKLFVYEFFYRNYSENVHTIDLLKGFATTEESNKAQIIQIRDFQDCERIFSVIGTIMLETYSNYVKERIPEKSEDFLKYYFYLNDKFKNLNKLKINYIK